MRVLLVAAPLVARSGGYRTTYELVDAARAKGLDWSAVIGMRPGVPGAEHVPAHPFVDEGVLEAHGRRLVAEIVDALEARAAYREAEVVITLIAQSDMALARTRARGKTWVAYVRGLPWPDVGEQSRLRTAVHTLLEARALRAAHEVWTTTEVLAEQVRRVREPVIVPPGIAEVPRRYDGGPGLSRVVWAARLEVDKDPRLFLDTMAGLPDLPASMWGQGPLEADLRRAAPPNVTLEGWGDPARLWDDAQVFVSTSRREAFGRSAVEAALAGLPVVLPDTYGAARSLYAGSSLADQLVLTTRDPQRWQAAVRLLRDDADVRQEASDVVRRGAEALTIGRSVDQIQARLQHLRAS